MAGSHASVRSVRGGFWKEVPVLEVGVAAGLLLLFFLSDTFLETIAGIYILMAAMLFAAAVQAKQIGRASCRERVCKYVLLAVVAVSLKKKKKRKQEISKT